MWEVTLCGYPLPHGATPAMASPRQRHYARIAWAARLEGWWELRGSEDGPLLWFRGPPIFYAYAPKKKDETEYAAFVSARARRCWERSHQP